MRLLPTTIRPCHHDVRDRPASDTFADRIEHITFPFHHVAACCLAGAIGWAGLFAASRFALDVIVQFV